MIQGILINIDHFSLKMSITNNFLKRYVYYLKQRTTDASTKVKSEIYLKFEF